MRRQNQRLQSELIRFDQDHAEGVNLALEYMTLDGDLDQLPSRLVELMVNESGSGLQIDERDATNAPQEYERSGTEIGHELLKLGRLDVDAQRDDEHGLPRPWVVEPRNGALWWAGDWHLIHAEVVRVAVGLDRATERAKGLLADAEATRCEWVVNLRAHLGENHGPDVSQRDWIAIVGDQQLALLSLRSNGNAQFGCR